MPVKLLIAGLLLATAAVAHEGASGIVGERMNVMKTMGQHLKALGEMLQGRTPFNSGSLRLHARALSENCHKAHTMFPAGSGGPHSRALPAVWERPDAFAAEMQRFHEATAALENLSSSGELADAAKPFAEVSRACASCHETFRQPE